MFPIVLLVLSQIVCEVEIPPPESIIQLKPYLSVSASVLVTDFPEYPDESTVLAYYDSLIYSGIPTRMITDVEERLAYEAAMIQVVVGLNQQRYHASHDSVIERLKVYFERFPDSVDIVCGGELRAILLYNYGEAKYYTSYVHGVIRNAHKRKEAREIYQRVLETYPNSIAAEFAQVTLIWYKLEAGEEYWDETIDEFGNIVKTSRIPEVRMLAAYGTGLAYFYKGDYENAALWFLDEKGYELLGVTSSREHANDSLLYSEGADSLVPISLFKRAVCLERLENPYAAFALYQHIAKCYPNWYQADEAWTKIVEYYIHTSQIDEADNVVRRIKYKMTENPRVYRRAYGYGLALLYQYYESVDDTINSAKYVKKMQSELGSSEMIEQVYYFESFQHKRAGDISALKQNIERIRSRNPRSTYLPDPLFLLSELLIETENFEEAEEVIIEIQKWPDQTAVRDIMPKALYNLGSVYETMGRYYDALEIYQGLASEYPEHSEGFNAFKKVIDLHIAGGRAKAIESLVGDRWGHWFGAKYDLEKAKELYCYALMQLRDYYFEVGDQERAEYFEKKLAELE